MGTKIILYVILCWLIVNLVAISLIQFRNDFSKYKKEAQFIMSKGTLAHKITFILMCWFVLPFTFIASIKNILNNHKNK